MSETLIAMAIFAIGFSAVASIFPIGTLLQKQTADEVIAQQVADNAKALIMARKFLHADLTDPAKNPRYSPNAMPNDFKVNPILQTQASGDMLDPPGKLDASTWERWTLNDRSYFLVRDSDLEYHPGHNNEVLNPYASEYGRAYYWVPMIRRTEVPTSASDWQVFVFVLRSGDPGHPVYGYDRQGITTNLTDKTWANYDGFLTPKWYVPGVYGMTVTISGSNRFVFPNRYGTQASTGFTSTDQFEVQVGDQVLDNNGTIHTVLTADATGVYVNGTIPQRTDADGSTVLPNKLWYGRPAWEGRPSPTKLIIAIGDAVE